MSCIGLNIVAQRHQNPPCHMQPKTGSHAHIRHFLLVRVFRQLKSIQVQALPVIDSNRRPLDYPPSLATQNSP
jgi:hypothetical protein